MDRFIKGIRKSFDPCPLIGPKWLQEFPNGKPADFRFFGIVKLAKAMGYPPARVAQILMRNVSLGGIDVDVSVTDDFLIDINHKGKSPTTGNASKAPPANKRKDDTAAGAAKPSQRESTPNKKPKPPAAGKKPAAKSTRGNKPKPNSKERPNNWGNK
ncbi:MAG: hypothetical protein K8S55_13355 [Phycisphaerae bacterium]|nr:hypothetical protein [Phycisphaerae bacterium]